jgi:hypothetical protein
VSDRVAEKVISMIGYRLFAHLTRLKIDYLEFCHNNPHVHLPEEHPWGKEAIRMAELTVQTFILL